MLDIFLHNSLTKKKEKFIPLQDNHVKIYACGITTYDISHLGHARSALIGDLLCRLFQRLSFKVLFVKNYTDIDDKIINRANKDKIAWQDLSADMIAHYEDNMNQLFIEQPNISPLASNHIPEMIEMIEELIKQGFAYEVKGDVFFKTSKLKNYGILSGKNTDQLIAGWRVEINQKKTNPLDFSLWKKHKENEPFFESPWGNGRPGWHIECSAMSLKYLGRKFDIHIGGSDLIFPHHENEIAQSESFLAHKHVSYWLHHEMVRVEGQKMSKSTNNFLSVADALSQYDPELIRFYLLSTHYRSIIDFKKDSIKTSVDGLNRLYRALGSEFIAQDVSTKQLLTEFLSALADDLNTPKAISILFNWANQINKLTDEAKKYQLRSALFEAGRSIGIFNSSFKKWFTKSKIHQTQKLSDTEISDYIEKRTRARQDKDWVLSDKIRDLLVAQHITIQDKNGVTTWQRDD